MIAMSYVGMPKKSKHATQLRESAQSARRAKATKSSVNAAGEEKSKESEAEQAQVEQQSNGGTAYFNLMNINPGRFARI